MEVTRAAADRSADGVSVRAGEAIALVDGRLIGSAPDALSALLAGLAGADAAGAGIVSVYTGAAYAGSREELRERCEAAFAGVEVEVLDGGQPLYELIAAVEA